MTFKPFYISSYENDSGLDQYAEAFLIPERAFPQLEDAYAFRGRIKRREGFSLLGRLRRELTALALTNADGTATYNEADILSSVRATEANAEIQNGTLVITIDRGNPNETIYEDSTTDGILTYTSGAFTGAGTVNYITGEITISFTVAPGAGITVDATFFYYPSLPVTGLPQREDSTLINDEELIAFDTKYAYKRTGGEFVELLAGTTWSGLSSNLFWTTNYWQNANGELFWATNFSGPAGDPIRYFDGTAWTTFNPQIDTAGTPNRLQQCLILLPYKERLLAMNTYEGTTLAGSTQFAQRIRFSGAIDPTILTTSWLDTSGNKGGFIDIPTNEAIISAAFIKDVLIIKCEQSSWKLIYNGNENFPFDIQKINTELGAESTFSLVGFDRGVFAIGNFGITSDDSVNVARIDEKIPDIIFNFNNSNAGPQRVYGIRDYKRQLVLWSYPNFNDNPIFPNKVLVFNYINATYSIFNDSFTCFGHFQKEDTQTWATLPYSSWTEWNVPWNSGSEQAKYPEVIAGNQQGYVEILNQKVSNDVSLSITAITPAEPVVLTIPNHNLQTGQFIKVSNIAGTGAPNPDTLNDTIYRITYVSADTLSLEFYNSVDEEFQNVALDAGGTYIGLGQVKVLNNIKILTKRFSPFYEIGGQVKLGYCDFFLNKTDEGELTLNQYVNESQVVAINDPNSVNNEGILGTNILPTYPENLNLIPFQGIQDKIWHRMYFYSITQNFQFELFFSDVQMADEAINESDVVLHAMTLYMSDNVRLIQ